MVAAVPWTVACGGGRLLGDPPAGAEPEQLQMVWRPGTVVRTQRIFLSSEPVRTVGRTEPPGGQGIRDPGTTEDGTLPNPGFGAEEAAAATAASIAREARVWREDVYRQAIEAVDPRGFPTAATRVYDRSRVRIEIPGRPLQERIATVAGETLSLRAGRPPTIAGEPVDNVVARGLTLEPFDRVFLTERPVWRGARWRSDASRTEALRGFLRTLGLVTDRIELVVAWTDTRTAPTGERLAILDITWTAAGLMQSTTGTTRSAHVEITGELAFDLDTRLVTGLLLRGRHLGTGASFRIQLTRELLGRTTLAATTPLAPLDATPSPHLPDHAPPPQPETTEPFYPNPDPLPPTPAPSNG